MSLIPLIFSDVHPRELDLRHYWHVPLEREPLRSLSLPLAYLKSKLSHLDDINNRIHIGKDGFDLKLDVQHFEPEEINVKTVDNSIIVEAKHEEKKDSDSSYISRQFVRRYELPKEFNPEQVVSSLSSDGILSIKCPKSNALEGAKVREIQIQPTGPARLIEKKHDDTKVETIKENPEKKSEEKTEEKK